MEHYDKGPARDVDSRVSICMSQLDRGLATILAAPHPRDRHLISDAVFVAIALFLIQQYCAAFLEGAGFEALGERHGRKARSLLDRIRARRISSRDLDATKIDIDAVLPQILDHSTDRHAIQAGEAAITAVVHDSGATKVQARSTAEMISAAVLKEHQTL